jgi:hypothetical protein
MSPEMLYLLYFETEVQIKSIEVYLHLDHQATIVADVIPIGSPYGIEVYGKNYGPTYWGLDSWLEIVK